MIISQRLQDCDYIHKDGGIGDSRRLDYIATFELRVMVTAFAILAMFI